MDHPIARSVPTQDSKRCIKCK